MCLITCLCSRNKVHVFFNIMLQSLALQMCPESISTVSIVNRCPANVTEWVSAAKRKSCNDLGQLQRCTEADDFVYHCVLNKEATMLLEVCAPTYLMPGKNKNHYYVIKIFWLITEQAR